MVEEGEEGRGGIAGKRNKNREVAFGDSHGGECQGVSVKGSKRRKEAQTGTERTPRPSVCSPNAAVPADKTLGDV